jgi:hypothetical protein
MSDADRERFETLMRQEENGTITEDGMRQLQEYRDRMDKQ